MKMYKRLLALLLALTMLLLCACGDDSSRDRDEDDSNKKDDAFADVKDELDELYDGLELDDSLKLRTTLVVDGEKYTVSWEIKKITGESGECFLEDVQDYTLLVFDPAVKEDVTVTLKATIKNSDKDKSTHTVKVTIPAYGSGSPGSSPSNPSGTVDVKDFYSFDEEVTITFTHTMGLRLQDVLDDYIEKFNRIYPNIKIVHQSAGGWGDINGQINTEIAGGNPPNIAYCYPEHVAMYNIAKAAVPLDDLINSTALVKDEYGNVIDTLGLSSEQKGNFIKSFYNEGKVYGDGKMYTLPLSKSTEVLYYDKTFFDKHGLKVPTTWDEMWEVCAKIKAIAPNDYPLGYDAEDNWFITLCEQMGSGYITVANGGEYLFDNATNKALVKELREYYQKGYFTTQALYGAYTSNLFVEQTDKRCYMCVGSSGGASYQMSNGDTPDGSFAFEVGVAPIPQVDFSNPKTISQGPNLCILKDSKTTDQEVIASWLFVKFLTTNVDFQAEFSMASGYMPVLKSVVVDHDAYTSWLGNRNGYAYLIPEVVYTCMRNTDGYFVPPAFNGSSKAREQVGDLMLKCLGSPSVDIDKAFKDAIKECEN